MNPFQRALVAPASRGRSRRGTVFSFRDEGTRPDCARRRPGHRAALGRTAARRRGADTHVASGAGHEKESADGTHAVLRRASSGHRVHAPSAREEPGVHRGHGADAGARHRRDHGDFQRGLRRRAAAAAPPRSVAPAAGRRGVGRQAAGHVRWQLRGHERRRSRFRQRPRRGQLRELQPGRRNGARARRRRKGDGQLLRRDGREADARTHVYRGRGPARQRSGRRVESSSVDAALRRTRTRRSAVPCG